MRSIVYAVGYFSFAMALPNNSIFAEQPLIDTHVKTYSPYVNQSNPTNVYWGDTHLHTNLSFDAYILGNRNLGPEEAYRFARGEAVTASNGMKAKLRRPLDFLVIADHASNAGVMLELEESNSTLLKSPVAQQWALTLQKINKLADVDPKKSASLSMNFFDAGFKHTVGDSQFRHSVWKKNTMTADRYNLPGKFTAFIGYEWTEVIYALHRVVIFKDGADKTAQVIPFSQYDSGDPEELWAYLGDYENRTGGEVLAIPHQGHSSGGFMFALENAAGDPISLDYAKTRSRWEPLYEVTQTRGDSEAHPLVSPTDEFADFETVPFGDFNEGSRAMVWRKELNLNYYESWLAKSKAMRQKNPSVMRQFEYARPALKLGIQQQAKLGVNPFKFGMIGSTDSHTGLSAVAEDNFWGKASFEPSPNRMMGKGTEGKVDRKALPTNLMAPWRMNNAAGYAAVWATENTRESLFAAMKRKEVYASTGPRMAVRFFGGWDYQDEDAFSPNLAQIGYEKGVPMGGDLTNAPKNKSPRFLIQAIKDPDGANLDRVQVIKGWHDKQGELHEKIYNVALSDGRLTNHDSNVKPVGNTVDIPSASYTNTIGDPELSVVWQDPDFNSNELAFYYARVLEIPTPRWTAYDAKFFGLKDIPEEVPMVTQERVYTSPVWYTPADT